MDDFYFSRIFKGQGNKGYENNKEKSVMKGRSQSRKNQRKLLLDPLFLAIISNQLEFVGLETVLFVKGTNPILSDRQK